jgi:hypothetical protein
MSASTADPRVSDAIARVRPRLSTPPRRPGQSLFSWRTQVIPVSRLVDDHMFFAYVTHAMRDISPFYARARISVTSVRMSRVRSLSCVAEKLRYKQARRLVRVLEARRISLFTPCLLQYRGESEYTLVLPPVVEQTDRADRALVIADGVHRLTALYHMRPQTTDVMVVLISGGRLPRPASTPVNLSEIELTAGEVSLAKKFRQLQPKLFRPTGATLRSDRFRFDSIDSFLVACRASAG